MEHLHQQTMKTKEYEVIFVDDGSTDDSVNMIKYYIKSNRVKNFTIIDLEENTGNASIPRNKGMQSASGEYIMFVDSDDYVSTDLAEVGYNFAKINNSDVVYVKMRAEGSGRGVPKAAYSKGNVGNADIIKNHAIYALSPQKFFRRSVIERHSLQFAPKIDKGEDMLFTMEFLMNSERISILGDKAYYTVITDVSGNNHLNFRKSSPRDYFHTSGRIFDAIYQGSKDMSIERRHEIAGKYCTRMFRHGQSNKFAIDKKMSIDEKRAWLEMYSHCLNGHLPKEADRYVTAIFHPKLEAIRRNDFPAVFFFEEWFKENHD